MTATMVEQATQKMSAIFPTQPNKSTIHLLPKGAEMITYSISDTIWIKAWMPDSFQKVQQKSSKSNDAFYNEFCDECHRNCYDFLSQYEDEDGEIEWDHHDLQNHCNVYDNGYSGQKCPEGNELEDDDFDFELAPMVFGISLNIFNDSSQKFYKYSDTAYFCAGRTGPDGSVFSSALMMTANVFGSEDYPEGICWGNNDRSETLRGIVESYLTTPFNSDLLPLDEFENNSNIMRRISQVEDNFDLDEDETLICKASDALMLLDASQDVSAFFQMLTAGYKSLDKAPHIMMIPLFESKIEKNGYTFDGYLTSLDDVGKRWFVTHDGLIIGQV